MFVSREARLYATVRREPSAYDTRFHSLIWWQAADLSPAAALHLRIAAKLFECIVINMFGYDLQHNLAGERVAQSVEFDMTNMSFPLMSHWIRE